MIRTLTLKSNGCYSYDFIGTQMKEDSYSYLKLQIESSLLLSGRKVYRIGSTGSAGILNEDEDPVSGTVILLQKIGGIWLETSRIVTQDGGFMFERITSKPSKVIAEKATYNDGIVSKITPESM